MIHHVMCIIIILCLYLQCVCINFVIYIILFCVFPLTQCSMIFLATYVLCMYFEFFLRADVDQSNNCFHDHDYESCYTLGNVRLDSMHRSPMQDQTIVFFCITIPAEA